MRAKIETLPLEEIYNDYITMKSLSEKYYYTSSGRIKDAADSLMTVLREEITKRGIKELERNYNDKLISESIEQIKKDVESSPYSFVEEKEVCEEDFEPKEKKFINQRDIVYTYDGGNTFEYCSPSKWKYDMGIIVGYVMNATAEIIEGEEYFTICAPRAVKNITLYGNDLKNGVDEEYHVRQTLFDASRSYNGEMNTNILYNSMEDTSSRCALTIVGKYNVDGVEDGKIEWYVPACGEMKLINVTLSKWIQNTFDIKEYTSLLTSDITYNGTDSFASWVYSLHMCEPTLSLNPDWEQTLLPFAKVKIKQD